MLLDEVVRASASVAAASRRNDKLEILADLLRCAPADEAEIVAAWLTGQLRQGRIGAGAALIGAARGDPATESTLRVAEVDECFGRIAALSGAGAATEKARRLRELLAKGTAAEQSFLVRLLFGELRQGALEGLMVEAVARASGLPPPRIRRAVMARGGLSGVVGPALSGDAGALSDATVTLFRPVQPMLAQPAEDVASVLARQGEVSLEYKLDGARVQVHKDGEDIRVYSRGLREVTAAVPEVVELARSLPASSLILDGEAIALRTDGRPHPFQVTMRRFGRRLEVERMRAELPLSVQLFDLLYLDGHPRIDDPYATRTALLEEQAAGAGTATGPSQALVERTRAREPREISAFLLRAIEAGHEGIMAKDASAPYEAGARGAAWLKIKQADTLDLVVLAAEWGNGRRQGWLSNLHLGARDPRGNTFVMLGKTFKGLTDEVLEWQTQALLAREIGREGIVVHVRPELVVEIAFNELQASSRYPGGLALRFARVKRYRSDKTAEEADTIERVWEIYRRSTAGL